MKTSSFKQLTVAMGIAVGMGGSGLASAAPISSIQIIDFSLTSEAIFVEITNKQINTSIQMGIFQGSAGWDPLTAPAGTPADKNAGIVGFDFVGGGTAAMYTSPDDLSSSESPQFGVHAAPSGDITGGVMTLDLSAWSGGFSGEQFSQGGSTSGNMVISNLTALGGGAYSFEAAWVYWAPINLGVDYNWTLTGVATVVPVPAAAWLLGSGLVGLVGVARRRK